MPNASEVLERENRIAELKLRGHTGAQIAQELGIGERTVWERWSAWCQREKAGLVEEDPLDVVFENIAGFRDLRRLASKVFDECAGQVVKGEDGTEVTLGVNTSARLGALKLIAELRVREIDLRQQTGLLPKNLGRLQVDLDVRWIIDQIIGLIEKHDVPPVMQDELLALLSRDQPELEPAL